MLPLDDRLLERLNAALVGRPDLMGGRTSLTVYEGMVGMTENVFINVKNRSHTITAEVQIPKGGGNGVILAQAGRFGGWSLYLKDGKPRYAYNFLGLKTYKVTAPEALPAGKATLRFAFTYDGGGLGKGGTGTIFVNGKKVAEGRIDRTQGNVFSADEGADVGLDGETPVTDDYKEGDNKFTGKIKKVVIEVGPVKLGAADREKLKKSRAAAPGGIVLLREMASRERQRPEFGVGQTPVADAPGSPSRAVEIGKAREIPATRRGRSRGFLAAGDAGVPGKAVARYSPRNHRVPPCA